MCFTPKLTHEAVDPPLSLHRLEVWVPSSPRAMSKPDSCQRSDQTVQGNLKALLVPWAAHSSAVTLSSDFLSLHHTGQRLSPFKQGTMPDIGDLSVAILQFHRISLPYKGKRRKERLTGLRTTSPCAALLPADAFADARIAEVC